MDTQEKVGWIYHRKNLYIIFAVFILFLATTFFAWKITKDVVNQEHQARFYQDSQQIKNWIQERFNSYVTYLHGAQGFFEESKNITAAQWSSYIKRSKITELYPGVSSISFVQRVKSKDKDNFIKAMRSEGNASLSAYSSFDIHPKSQKDEYYVVKFVEPIAGLEKALGFDVSSEEKRFTALLHARDSGKITSSGRITLAITKKTGFALFAPIYERGTTGPQTLKERQESLVGFVYPSFKENAVFSSIFENSKPYPNINFELYDGLEQSFDHLLYSNYPAHKASDLVKSDITSLDNIKVDGDTWTLVIAAKPSYKLTLSQELLPSIVLASGLIFSLITLCVFLWTLKKHVKQHKIQKLPDSNPIKTSSKV